MLVFLFIQKCISLGVWKLYRTISLTSICGGGGEKKQQQTSIRLSSLTCSRGPNPDPHRPTNNNDKIDIFLVNHNTARKLRPPRTWPRAMPIPGAEAGSSAGLPGHPACYSSRSASGCGPRSGADGGRAGSGASGRLLTATPAAWDGGAPGRGLWHLRSRRSPGRAARAAARDTAQDTQPGGGRLRCSRHATRAPASEDDVTARGLASRGPGSSQASAELSFVSRGLSVFISGKFPVTPERSVGEKEGPATC